MRELAAARPVHTSEWISRALLARFRGNSVRSDSLLCLAVSSCGKLSMASDAQLLAVFDESQDPGLRRIAGEAGRRRLATYANELRKILQVARLHLQHGRATEAMPLLVRAREEGDRQDAGREPKETDTAWSAYLLAHYLASIDPDQATALAERALAGSSADPSLAALAWRLVERLTAAGSKLRGAVACEEAPLYRLRRL